jgi:hypothetical protein
MSYASGEEFTSAYALPPLMAPMMRRSTQPRWPACACRNASPWLRKMSATTKAGAMVPLRRAARLPSGADRVGRRVADSFSGDPGLGFSASCLRCWHGRAATEWS